MFTTRGMQLVFMFAMATMLGLSFPLSQAQAYTCPGPDTDAICSSPSATCDSDLDGFMDAEECAGITIPHETDSNQTVTISTDPKIKDLFLIIVRAGDSENEDCNINDESLLPPNDNDLLYPSTDPQTAARLGLSVHVIKGSQAPGQLITANQHAVKMTESCSTADPDVAGEAIPGIPSRSVLYGKVFTYVIQDKINSACQDGFSCTDASGNSKTALELTNAHIINTFNHELGHMLGLSVNNDRKVGNHWPAGTGNELDQFVECSSNTRKGIASCDVSDIHGLPDVAGYRLK